MNIGFKPFHFTYFLQYIEIERWRRIEKDAASEEAKAGELDKSTSVGFFGGGAVLDRMEQMSIDFDFKISISMESLDFNFFWFFVFIIH